MTAIPSSQVRRVAIVGGGFSGTLQAINLLRHDGPAAVLIERRPQIGCGVAYSAADPALLLNVRAANMSALPDAPDHFVRWLATHGYAADGFVPRMVYGQYLADLLHATRAQAPGRLEIVQGNVVSALADEGGARVTLAEGHVVEADVIVLALGNLPPVPPTGLDPDSLSTSCYAADPWSGDLAAGLTDEDAVLIIGTGLTMVDAALLLDERGFCGRIIALSRRGLAPRAHGVGGHVAAGLSERPAITASALLREVRGRTLAIGWRAAVDELRPFSRGMWLAASPDQRARFLRHLRPWWEVHRHRIAPVVAERLDRLRAEGRLTIVAGKTLGFAPDREGVAVAWRPRGEDRIEHLRVRRVINCSGPHIDLGGTHEPLLRQLRGDDVIVPDAANLGLAVDQDARVIGADGAANPRLYALGPMTRGSFWEITAVPDIRMQAWTLARRLSNAHWVAGEGL